MPRDCEGKDDVFVGRIRKDISGGNGIVLSAEDLDKPNPLADPALAKHAQNYVETLVPEGAHSVELDVRKAIYLLLPMGRATIEQIAQTLGMNVRTLQRRLFRAQRRAQALRESLLED